MAPAVVDEAVHDREVSTLVVKVIGGVEPDATTTPEFRTMTVEAYTLKVVVLVSPVI